MDQKLIALLTDFGNDDPFVGIMKGVICQIYKKVIFIDLTHLIPPADVQRGAFVLWQAARDLPPGTIFLSVVDPGVGTDRGAIMLECGGQIFIGPDNGLFSYLTYQNDCSAWELSNPDYQLKDPTNTFHGRDIFAPAAAHAALGRKGVEFGNEVQKIVQLDQPHLVIQKHEACGEIISWDRFGNLFTTLGVFVQKGRSLHIKSWVDGQSMKINNTREITISIKNESLPFVDTFDSLPLGTCGGLIGSTGLLEIAANQDSAKSILSIDRGTRVNLEWTPS
jgi:S-adenosylmethionine hydrolase